MACGLPVIVTDMTGWADAVIDGQNGFIVKSRSVEMLKEKILMLYERRALSTEMGKKALDTIKDRHNWDAYGERLQELLSHVYRSGQDRFKRQ
jgi:glycosyltransferase involved in cell wall biosynthesis